jgi:hypothetical protein
VDKENAILNHCRGKKVIDIGCVEELSYFSPEKMRQTLHYRLRQETPDLVGVDLEEAGVAALNELGCDCHVSFAEDVGKQRCWETEQPSSIRRGVLCRVD